MSMEFWIVACACLTLGFIVGWGVATRPHPDQIDRFVMLDQQNHEQREAYNELAKRLGDRQS
jgi:hypothetical protein